MPNGATCIRVGFSRIGLLVGLLGLLSGCDDSLGDTCGIQNREVTCLSVGQIVPTSVSGEETDEVDAIRDACGLDLDGDGNPVVVLEPVGDHTAAITFRNDVSPVGTAEDEDSSEGALLTIDNFTVSYTLNRCTLATPCPILPGFRGTQTVTVGPGEQVTQTFALVPSNVKNAFARQVGDLEQDDVPPAGWPTYTATYRFQVRAVLGEGSFELVASQTFTIGNFDTCPEDTSD